jgi:deoxyribodipyrimidine photo-lyase
MRRLAASAASRWWLHHSLHALDASLRERSHTQNGRATDVLAKLASQADAGRLLNRRYEPAALQTSAAVEKTLAAASMKLRRSMALLPGR